MGTRSPPVFVFFLQYDDKMKFQGRKFMIKNAKQFFAQAVRFFVGSPCCGRLSRGICRVGQYLSGLPEPGGFYRQKGNFVWPQYERREHVQ